MSKQESIDTVLCQLSERMYEKGYHNYLGEYYLELYNYSYVIRVRFDKHIIVLNVGFNSKYFDIREHFNENGSLLAAYLAVVNKSRSDDYTFAVSKPNNMPVLELIISYETELPTADELEIQLDYLVDKFAYYAHVMQAIIYNRKIPMYEAEPYKLYHNDLIHSSEYEKALEEDNRQKELRKAAEEAERIQDEERAKAVLHEKEGISIYSVFALWLIDTDKIDPAKYHKIMNQHLIIAWNEGSKKNYEAAMENLKAAICELGLADPAKLRDYEILKAFAKDHNLILFQIFCVLNNIKIREPLSEAAYEVLNRRYAQLYIDLFNKLEYHDAIDIIDIYEILVDYLLSDVPPEKRQVLLQNDIHFSWEDIDESAEYVLNRARFDENYDTETYISDHYLRHYNDSYYKLTCIVAYVEDALYHRLENVKYLAGYVNCRFANGLSAIGNLITIINSDNPQEGVTYQIISRKFDYSYYKMAYFIGCEEFGFSDYSSEKFSEEISKRYRVKEDLNVLTLRVRRLEKVIITESDF